MDYDNMLTRRQYLMTAALDRIASVKGAASIEDALIVSEAIASTAIEHPEWDMDEEHTWAEWVAQS